jgi:thiamine biosynthesis lipoprotein
MWSFLYLWIMPLAISSDVPVPMVMEGRTMGTTYHITYFDSRKRNFQGSIDSLFKKVNQSINTYDPASEVSAFNRSLKGIAFDLPHLRSILRKCEEVYRLSHGAFDPTVMPLVNAWGFGPGKSFTLSPSQIDSIRIFVGFSKISITRDSILKNDPRMQLDFGGIGQGYGADVAMDFLKSKGIGNVLVELGGEGIALGKNLQKDKPWMIGILDPNSTRDDQFFKAYAQVNNQAFTTAGNYFNYRVINGKKYSHTINPATGYPVDLPLLSVSVFAADCTTADAWDTALLVMGHTAAIKLLKKNPSLGAILMYTSPDGKIETYISPVLKKQVTLESLNE